MSDWLERAKRDARSVSEQEAARQLAEQQRRQQAANQRNLSQQEMDQLPTTIRAFMDRVGVRRELERVQSQVWKGGRIEFVSRITPQKEFSPLGPERFIGYTLRDEWETWVTTYREENEGRDGMGGVYKYSSSGTPSGVDKATASSDLSVAYHHDGSSLHHGRYKFGDHLHTPYEYITDGEIPYPTDERTFREALDQFLQRSAAKRLTKGYSIPELRRRSP